MLISGFTFVRNIGKLNYPALEAISSVLPVCDEFVVNVCDSEDDTGSRIKSIPSPKIRILKSPLDDSYTERGFLLSENTNLALASCRGEWCFYVQADEVIHEDDLTSIREACEKYRKEKSVEGFLFDYLHFYGAYGVIAGARNWYRREVRIIRNHVGVVSVGDAQGFRVARRKLRVLHSGATVFHYGWVRPPRLMGLKNKDFFRLWHGNKYDNAFDKFEFEQQYGLRSFSGAHPGVMKSRIEKQDWTFRIDRRRVSWNLKNLRFLISDVIERMTGFRIGEHRNYRLISGKK